VLQWGTPVLESAITLITDNRLFYRGHDVIELAAQRSVEEVASLIWTGSFDATGFSSTPLHVIAGSKSLESLAFVNRAESILPVVSSRDPLAYDLRPRSVAQTGWRILNLLASVAAETSNLQASVEETLQQAWAPDDRHALELIRMALILCADHELNVSAFAARCVASAGSNPYAVTLAGLAAMEGVEHGGLTSRVETMLEELHRSRDLRGALPERLRRGEEMYGFGHRLYPEGDPRAEFLFEALRRSYSRSPELRFAFELAQRGEELLGEKPTVDFALVVLARVLKLRPGAPLTLFALGRTIGWIGHAIEQYGRDEIIRPRARYIGTMPA
jgi:citrate synthase